MHAALASNGPIAVSHRIESIKLTPNHGANAGDDTDPVKELFWSAVINGLIAVPIRVVMMLLASRRAVMGEHVIGARRRWLGRLATAAMAATVVAMLATL